MKQKLLILLFFSFSISFATPTDPPTGPHIGLLMQGYSDGYNSHFTFYVKNTGTETLTNIYVTNTTPNGSDINISIYPAGTTVIASLAPGEIDSVTFSGDKQTICNDQVQCIVYATTLASTQISDLSHEYDYDYDGFTYAPMFPYAAGEQHGTYQDLNNNAIIDVGDVINYTYNVISGPMPFGSWIYDDNAVVQDPMAMYTTGVHYITQADIDLGYVYNHSYLSTQTMCGDTMTSSFMDPNPCACPNPDGAIVTQLTSLLPNQISGTVKFNANNDNCTAGVAYSHRRVNSDDGANHTYSSYTNDNGDYHILIPNSGTYTSTALNNLGANFNSNPTSTAITSSGQNQDYANNNFCISSATGYADLGVGMFNTSNAVPGLTAYYQLCYYNNGTTALSGSIQLAFDGTRLTFGNASTAPSNTTANTLTWNYTNLLPFQYARISVQFAVQTPPITNLNDVLTFNVTGNPISGDSQPSNNTVEMNQTVRSSFDPNDKTVIEGGIIDIGQTGNYLHYVTRFQNSGTANATTVVIKETLDPKLDWDTFEPIASSHDSNIQIRNGNELTYTFSNINLPYEAANEPASHGWMAYRIKPKSNVMLWDIMSSSSNIYFDYNLPIVTNTVNTQVTALSNMDYVKGNFTVYPNPATNFITIEAKENLQSVYEIVDLNGKSLLKGTTQSLQPINISGLQVGFYFLNLNTSEGKATYKFIKS